MRVVGAGGGKSGGGAAGISEDPDTLSSVAYARFVDLIGEGEISGLVNGDASIYLDGVPLRNLDGTPNYKPFASANVKGTQSQLPIPGFSGTSSESAVGIRLYQTGGKYIRSVPDADADAVRVTVSVNGFSLTSAEGKVGPTSVTYKIWIRVVGGSWVLGFTDTIKGKTGSTYQRSQTVSLTGLGSGPYEVAVERITADSSSGLLVDNLFWDSYAVLNYEPFSYPNSALVAMGIDGRYFSSVPTRAYHVRGLLVRIPSNYNPVTRVYTGVWDGTFVVAYTNNPAWCFYDLVTNKRYGLGKRISDSQISKWDIYAIGRHCDEMVPTGLSTNVFTTNQASNYSPSGRVNAGVPKRDQTMEPRFTLNCVINTKEDAYKVINNLASVFRGMAYWSANSIAVTQDRYVPTSMQWTNANVIGGMFTYEGSARADRHTTVSVGWNNPDEDFRQCFEYVEDRAGIERYGVRPVEVLAFGTTSRGQARRVGLWLLYTERMEKDAVRFRAGWDSARVLPGDRGKILDSNRVGARWGGRVLSANTNEVTLDAPVTLTVGTYKLSTMTIDGSVVEKAVNISLAGSYETLTVATAYAAAPAEMSIWTLASSTVVPMPVRVISIVPAGAHEYDITVLESNPSKFNAIEQGTPFEELNYSFLSYKSVPTVLGLVATENSFTTGVSNDVQTNIEVSWDALSDPTIRGYVLKSVSATGNIVVFPEQKDPFRSITRALPDNYIFSVKAVNSLGYSGPWTDYVLSVTGAPPLPIEWENISGAPRLFRAVSKGYLDTAYTGSVGLLNADGATRPAGALSPVRSYTLYRIRRSDAVVTFSQTYDVYGGGANTSGRDAAALAADLNATGLDSVVVVTVYDEPKTYRLSGGLAEAMYRCGASRAVFGSTEFKVRSAYVLVGIGGCGETNGFEAYSGSVDNDTNAWCDVAFTLQSGQLIVSGTGSKPRTLVDYGYIGDLNATNDVTLIGKGAVLVRGNSVTKIGATSAWDAGAYSKESFKGGAFAAGVASANAMFGLNSDPTAGNGYTTIDYAVYCDGPYGGLWAYESGTSTSLGVAWVAGAPLLVSYDGRFVRYSQSGTVLRTVAVPSGLRLYYDSSLYSNGHADTGIRFGPMTDLNGAFSAAEAAQATADGKIESYFSPSPPVSASLGDIWFDTDDGYKQYRYNGSSWVLAADTRIGDAISAAADALATADGKVVSFVQTSPPTAEGVGDLWFDSDDGYKVYRWNGSSWVELPSGTSQLAAGAAYKKAVTEDDGPYTLTSFVTGGAVGTAMNAAAFVPGVDCPVQVTAMVDLEMIPPAGNYAELVALLEFPAGTSVATHWFGRVAAGSSARRTVVLTGSYNYTTALGSVTPRLRLSFYCPGSGGSVTARDMVITVEANKR